MIVGIVVQSIAITSATLGAFLIGLRTFPDHLAGAQTMAFATLSLSELLRAYTSRSEHYSVFAIGVFSNKYMQYAVLASLAILLAIIYVPFLDPIFNTAFLGWAEWAEIIPLIAVPSVAAEITKWFLRQADKRRLQGMAEG
jgi:P-type Ca2+ transporter type 2C